MMPCPDKEMLLHGLLAGELDAVNTLSCEAHLQECAGCAAEFARLQALRSRLRTPGVAFEASPALRARITAALGAAAGRDTATAAPNSAERVGQRTTTGAEGAQSSAERG